MLSSSSDESVLFPVVRLGVLGEYLDDGDRVFEAIAASSRQLRLATNHAYVRIGVEPRSRDADPDIGVQDPAAAPVNRGAKRGGHRRGQFACGIVPPAMAKISP